jgi:hypothetical protein
MLTIQLDLAESEVKALLLATNQNVQDWLLAVCKLEARKQIQNIVLDRIENKTREELVDREYAAKTTIVFGNFYHNHLVEFGAFIW